MAWAAAFLQLVVHSQPVGQIIVLQAEQSVPTELVRSHRRWIMYTSPKCISQVFRIQTKLGRQGGCGMWLVLIASAGFSAGGSIPSWMQAGLSITAIKSHLLTPKGTGIINSTPVFSSADEPLGGELLKSTWTRVELFLPLSSFHPSFPAKSSLFKLRKRKKQKKQLCCASPRLELWAGASCNPLGKYNPRGLPIPGTSLRGTGLSARPAKLY